MDGAYSLKHKKSPAPATLAVEGATLRAHVPPKPESVATFESHAAATRALNAWLVELTAKGWSIASVDSAVSRREAQAERDQIERSRLAGEKELRAVEARGGIEHDDSDDEDVRRARAAEAARVARAGRARKSAPGAERLLRSEDDAFDLGLSASRQLVRLRLFDLAESRGADLALRRDEGGQTLALSLAGLDEIRVDRLGLDGWTIPHPAFTLHPGDEDCEPFCRLYDMDYDMFFAQCEEVYGSALATPPAWLPPAWDGLRPVSDLEIGQATLLGVDIVGPSPGSAPRVAVRLGLAGRVTRDLVLEGVQTVSIEAHGGASRPGFKRLEVRGGALRTVRADASLSVDFARAFASE